MLFPNAAATCPNRMARWYLIIILDVLIEAGIVVVLFFLLWPLQMSKIGKSLVLIAFGFRLPYVSTTWLYIFDGCACTN
jgi:hypothetical protein